MLPKAANGAIYEKNIFENIFLPCNKLLLFLKYLVLVFSCLLLLVFSDYIIFYDYLVLDVTLLIKG